MSGPRSLTKSSLSSVPNLTSPATWRSAERSPWDIESEAPLLTCPQAAGIAANAAYPRVHVRQSWSGNSSGRTRRAFGDFAPAPNLSAVNRSSVGARQSNHRGKSLGGTAERPDKDLVVAFVGKPHRIGDGQSQVRKALAEIGFDQYYQAEQTGWVLYLEGSTDLAILQAFASALARTKPCGRSRSLRSLRWKPALCGGQPFSRAQGGASKSPGCSFDRLEGAPDRPPLPMFGLEEKGDRELSMHRGNAEHMRMRRRPRPNQFHCSPLQRSTGVCAMREAIDEISEAENAGQRFTMECGCKG